MKKQIKLPLLALGVLTGGLLSSCSNETEPSLNTNTSMLARAPKVIAYSGDHIWSPNTGTRGTDMNANMWNQNWDCPPRPAEDLTPDELAELKALLSKGKPIQNEIVIPFENYYVQQIYKGEDRYNTHDRCYQEGCNHINGQTELGSGHMDKLVAQGTYGYEHVNNFNNGTNTNRPENCGCGESHFGTTLMTGMPTEGIDPDKQFGFHETWGTAHDYNNYYIVEYKGYYYVGFDYEAHKPDQGTHNHGEGLDIERDWNFTDWIVRITPAYPKGQTPEKPEDTPNVPGDKNETCDKCGDPAHEDGNCDNPECKVEECNPDYHEGDSNVGGGEDSPEPPVVNPAVPGDRHDNEVEINLNGTDKGDILESHLSIHVRAATDVEVFIPVPVEYYVEADDMAIVMQHEINHMVHGGPYVLEYELKDSDPALTVTLTVAFEEEGIRITTDGITQEVIDWCQEKCQDGITFEVWNYFDKETGINLDMLKDYLNQATVKFLDECPDFYINAFTEDNGVKDDEDCTVSIVEEQRNQFEDPTVGPHLNGSTKNEIYENKNHSSEE